MNILYITNHLNTGGITSYVLTLAAGLKKQGHGIWVASSNGDKLDTFRQEGAGFIPIPIKTKQEVSLGVFLSAHQLKKTIWKDSIDIVHTHSRTTQIVGSLLHKSTGVSHITTCHGFFKPRLFRLIFPSWTKIVIAISEPVKEHLIWDFHVGVDRIAVIHNGIDLDKFSTRPFATNISERKKEFGLRDGPVVGIVARLSDVKGHIYLIEAMQEVIAQIPKAQLFIVGEGKMKETLLTRARKLDILKSIIFLDRIDDTRKVLSLMDVFAMPSLEEGLGLALMEAMASGLAVVGSDIGGIKSLIKDRVTGLLVESRNSHALAQALLAVLTDEKLSAALGENASSYIRLNFSQETMLLQTEEAYKRCLSA